MRNALTAIATVAIFGTALFITEHNRRSRNAQHPVVKVNPVATIAHGGAVRAPGKIEGLTEEVELRARIAEQIREIHVDKGQWVSQGEVLVSLDSARLASERDLAAALLTEAEARKQRLDNGFRPSEIETSKQEYAAAMAELEGAEKAYNRAYQLLRNNAVSLQEVDDLSASLNAHRASAAAARGRLETVEAPPRSDDLLAASAAIRAAESRLKIAQINLDRAEIKAPADGQILAIEAKVGELTGPESTEPLIIMSDTSQLRTVAEVDEYDALKIEIGQLCEISSDGTEGVLARGHIVEIEPQMHRKQLFGQWAGERSDTYSRRVWIDLKESVELPVGLPVDVYIEISKVD